MTILKSAIMKKNKAKHNKSEYQNSDYRLTKKEQEALTVFRILVVFPILLLLILYAVS